MHSAIRFSVASLDELAVNLDWSPSSLGAPETVNTFIHNVGGRDWLQDSRWKHLPSFLFCRDATHSGHYGCTSWGGGVLGHGDKPSKGILYS